MGSFHTVLSCHFCEYEATGLEELEPKLKGRVGMGELRACVKSIIYSR